MRAAFFPELEGLRGYLAWVVVLSHIAQVSNVTFKGLGPMMVYAGQNAVLVFIIVSGFVITHLRLENPEPYGRYIARRFMRIFPLLAVTCVVGYLIEPSYVASLPYVVVREGYTPQFVDFAIQTHQSIQQFFWPHVILHATMLHGMVGSNVLPFSEYAFNAPAWSLSLEWQFYLIAPFVIAAATKPKLWPWLAAGSIVATTAFSFDLLGKFYSPSFLPAASAYFAVGIASRLAYPYLKHSLPRQPRALAVLLAALLPLGWLLLPFTLWALFFLGLLVGALPFERAFKSRLSSYFGLRSYSIYLIHAPLLSGLCAFLNTLPISHGQMFVILLGLVPPLTIGCSELAYHFIERPGIRIGSRAIRPNGCAGLKG